MSRDNEEVNRSWDYLNDFISENEIDLNPDLLAALKQEAALIEACERHFEAREIFGESLDAAMLYVMSGELIVVKDGYVMVDSDNISQYE
jgi:hypothetical protein